MKTGINDKRLLAGIRVLDLSDEKASFCSKVLAGLGAHVIKIESLGGDPSRKIGPFWKNAPHPERSLSFCYNNTNKLGITLDLEHDAGREIFLGLIRKCDVVVETFQPGYLDGLGLGFESLRGLNPGLIMASITGFGQNGPRKGFKSCDLVACALGGQMYVCGSPLLPPVKAYGEQSYFTGSLYGAVGILLALRKRVKTGEGDHIDISLQEAVASTLEHVLVRYFHEQVIARRRGNRHWNDFFCLLPCISGFIHLTPFLGWESLVDLLDREGMAEDLGDEKWKDEEYRIAHFDHVMEVLGAWTKTHTVYELFELGQLMRFPWAPVHSPKEILASPQLKKRGFFADFEHPELGCVLRYPGSAFRFSSPCSVPRKRAPLIGEDNVQVYQQELGLGEVDLERLSSVKAI